MITGCYLAKIFYEKLKHGCWLSLLDEHLEDVGDRVQFDTWDISECSVFNNSKIQFKITKFNTKVVAIAFYSSEFDSDRYFATELDNAIDLLCDCTYAIFAPEELKVTFC